MTEGSEIIDAAALPERIHQVFESFAADFSDRVALVDDRGRWSYGDLKRFVDEIAEILGSLGIRAGDRVIIVSENCIALAALLLAASRVDAWAIVVNPRLSERELDQIRDHSGARRVFFTVGVSKEAAVHAARFGADVRILGPLSDIGVGSLNEGALVEPHERAGSKQVAVLIYTSGTTGAPKGVMLSHQNLLFSAISIARSREMTSDDKVYVVLPVSHIVGISLLIMTLMVGGCVRLVTKYDPAALTKAMAEEGITVLNGVPATYQRLLEYKRAAAFAELDRGSLRLMAVAGAPLDLSLKAQVEDELGLPLLNGYGITECSPGISGVQFRTPRTDEAVGALLPGIEARIVSSDGSVVTDNGVGELHVRGLNVMLGYYRSPDLTAKAIDADGWFNTGDLARFDDGCLFVMGRTKEMIIRSGFNVYPAEVEAVLNSHEDVVQSAVVGRAVTGNEEIVGFVQFLRGAHTTAEQLMAYASEQLTPYKRPSEIIVLDALPATSTGKILKHQLAEMVRVKPTRAEPSPA